MSWTEPPGGQEEFDALTSSYYKGAGACALVFSTVDRASFDAIESWKRKVEDECGPIVCTLVQNKVDLISSAAMSNEEVEEKARALGLPLLKTCVKDDLNVALVFESMAARYIQGGGDTSEFASIAAAGGVGRAEVVSPPRPGKGEGGGEGGEGEEVVLGSPGASLSSPLAKAAAPLSPPGGSMPAGSAAAGDAAPPAAEAVITMSEQDLDGEGGVISKADILGEGGEGVGSPRRGGASKSEGEKSLASPLPPNTPAGSSASTGAGGVDSDSIVPIFTPQKPAGHDLALELDAEARIARTSTKGGCGCLIC